MIIGSGMALSLLRWWMHYSFPFLLFQVFEGTSGIDNKYTTVQFTGEVISLLFFGTIGFIFVMACRTRMVDRMASFTGSFEH